MGGDAGETRPNATPARVRGVEMGSHEALLRGQDAAATCAGSALALRIVETAADRPGVVIQPRPDGGIDVIYVLPDWLRGGVRDFVLRGLTHEAIERLTGRTILPSVSSLAGRPLPLP